MNLTKSKNRISATPAATEPPALSLTAQEVIRRAQNGDAAAFECLYRSHSRHVYSICLRMLKNRADAEDITQQVFLQVFRKIGTFCGDSGFCTWLHRVTVNAVLMHLRRKNRTEIAVSSFDASDADGAAHRKLGFNDASMQGAIHRMNLVCVIRQLPLGYKRLFLMHQLIGFKHTEIARRLRCSRRLLKIESSQGS